MYYHEKCDTLNRNLGIAGRQFQYRVEITSLYERLSVVQFE